MMQANVIDPTSVGMDAKRLERIKPAMQNYINQRGYAGIATLLARRGKIVHSEQVGWQDREGQIPMALDSIVRIYSMTKPIICTALMILHEAGRFHLSDPVAKFLPAFGKVKVLTGNTMTQLKEVDSLRPMTIKDLFTHMSGLSYSFLEDYPLGQMYLDAGLLNDSTISLEKLIGELARFPLAFQPGSCWHYSMSIDVLAHLIEILSGQSLQSFLQEQLFGPLGMDDTGFSVPDNKMNRLSAMYGHPDVAAHTISQIGAAGMTSDNQRRDVNQTYPASGVPNFARGGHGLFSTAVDYMRFAQMLLNGGRLDGTHILGRKTLELMHTNHVPTALLPYQMNLLPAMGYGFGLGSRVLLNVAASNLPGSVGEFGWGGAANTYYWVDPQEQLIGIFMAQYMMSFEVPQNDFQVLAYQAITD